MTMNFTTTIGIRACNSSGTVLATFSPADSVARDIGIATIEDIYNEFEDINFVDASEYIGSRLRIEAEFRAETKSIAGGAGLSTLEAVISARPSGGYFEVQFGNSTWVKARLESWDPGKADGKNMLYTARAAFVSMTLVTALP